MSQNKRDEMKTKICTGCHKEKTISEFYKHKGRKNGLGSQCKLCQDKQHKEYKDNNIEKIKIYQTKYHKERGKENYLKNKEKIKKWQLENKEKIALQGKKSRLKNKEKLIKYRKEYRKNNKEKISKNDKEWRKNNKEKINKRTNKHLKERRKTDINFKIICNLRTRIWNVLRGNNKSKKTIQLLGCTIEFLKNHLECQFTKGMNWDNYGTGWHGAKEWHIDHICPCDSFDLSKKTEQLKCFNYFNLQPLWALDNWQKGNKVML